MEKLKSVLSTTLPFLAHGIQLMHSAILSS